MSELAPFSEWTFALLPRLFIYPGGVWLLPALLFWRLLSGGYRSLAPRPLARSLMGANLLSLATAWTAISLLPLPGAPPLPFPADRFTLLALLALSLLLDNYSSAEGWLGAGVTLALIAPVAGGSVLLLSPGSGRLSEWLAALAVLAGLVGIASLRASQQSLQASARGLAWLGLGAHPLWASMQLPLAGVVTVSLVYTVVLAAMAFLARLTRTQKWGRGAAYVCWGWAALALLLALLP